KNREAQFRNSCQNTTVTTGSRRSNRQWQSKRSSSANNMTTRKKEIRRTFDNQPIDTIVADLNSFCAALFTMGMWKQRNVLEYWNSEYGLDQVKNLLPQSRFRFLARWICFRNVADPEPTEDEKKRDRAWKCRPFMEMIRQKFLSVANEEYQAID